MFLKDTSSTKVLQVVEMFKQQLSSNGGHDLSFPPSRKWNLTSACNLVKWSGDLTGGEKDGINFKYTNAKGFLPFVDFL